MLPLFFDAISEKEIVLLTHPILEGEILKHIEDSNIYKDYKQLVMYLEKCEDVLTLAGCNNFVVLDKIAKFDIKAKTFEIFKNNYAKAIKLGYPDPDIIFKQYFSAMPPFSGKKKHEFPDAFVIEAVRQHLETHCNDALLVVSKDEDWKKAFSNEDNVLFSESISNAITRINKIKSVLSDNMIAEVVKAVYNEMLSLVQFQAEFECYCVPGFEFVKDFEVDRIEIDSIDDTLIVPLKITRSSLLIKTTARITVDGQGVIVDDDRSVWFKEENDYIYKAYADMCLTDGKAEVDCEIEIRFDFDNLIESAQVSSVKLNNSFVIEVEGGEISLTDIDDEELCWYSRKHYNDFL